MSIVRTYRTLHRDLERSGTGPYRLTRLGAWAASRAPHLHYFFRRIALERYRLFVDLGSGDGIVTCTASLFTRAIGMEVDETLCRLSRHTAEHLGLGRRTAFLCGDYLTQRIRSADCLYLYPDKPFYALDALLSEWEGTLLVYGPHFPPRRLHPVERLVCGREQLVLYRNPPLCPPKP